MSYKLIRILILILIISGCTKAARENFKKHGLRSPGPEVISPQPELSREQAIEKYLKGRDLSPLEGVWVMKDNAYEVLITKNNLGIDLNFDYLGIITFADRNHSNWKQGEIKILLNETATNTIYTGFYYLGNKRRIGSTFIVKHNFNLIELSLPTGRYGRSQEVLLIKSYPKDNKEVARQKKQDTISGGTGFLIGGSRIIITNYHVVKDVDTVFAIFRNGEKIKLHPIAMDRANDIAILELTDIPNLIFKDISFGNSKEVEMGQKVFTIGYPTTQILGQNAKYSEGVVSSSSGIMDDPRFFQITVPVQPGNSGGPLFDEKGNVIGMVTATLNSAITYKITGSIPQNVNFGLKSSYIENALPDLSQYSLPKNKISSEAQESKHTQSMLLDSMGNNVVLIEGIN
jgi:S1-C subfamily serine protease